MANQHHVTVFQSETIFVGGKFLEFRQIIDYYPMKAFT
jgi:hypothetical protein